MAYYLGGDAKVIGGAINNMAANALGILCDGAKVGCALKLATSASAAAQCALLALRGLVVPADNGVVDASPERTIRNVGRISQSMNQTDSCVLDVLTGASYRVGDGIAPVDLPHHRAYGSVPRRFM
jgi:L-cysteine desulfidase